MTRLIDANALKEKIEIELNNNVGSYCDGLLGAKELIDSTPTVEMPCNDCCADTYRDGYEKGKADARPTGEWKVHGMIYYCSVCGHDYEQGGNNFCGNCGADMRGEEP